MHYYSERIQFGRGELLKWNETNYNGNGIKFILRYLVQILS